MTEASMPKPSLPGGTGCRIIAALNSNHNGDVDLALRLIDAAAAAGANGVKLEKRTVALAAVRQILDRPATAYSTLGPTYRKALERIDAPVEVLGRLAEHARGLATFIAPYDLEAFQQLRGVPFAGWVIEPPLVTHLPLLDALGRSGRPLIAKVAGSTPREVQAVLERLPGEVTLVNTLSMESVTGGVLEVAHLTSLRRFGRPVGHADNSREPSWSLMAVALGATLIEKPLTLDRTMAGPDHATSLTPKEFGELVRSVRALEGIIRSEKLRDPSPAEMDGLDWGRVSIVAARPIPRGTRLSRDMLALKPPFRGLSPAFMTFLEGRRVLYDIAEDDFVTFAMVEL